MFHNMNYSDAYEIPLCQMRYEVMASTAQLAIFVTLELSYVVLNIVLLWYSKMCCFMADGLEREDLLRRVIAAVHRALRSTGYVTDQHYLCETNISNRTRN